MVHWALRYLPIGMVLAVVVATVVYVEVIRSKADGDSPHLDRSKRRTTAHGSSNTNKIPVTGYTGGISGGGAQLWATLGVVFACVGFIIFIVCCIKACTPSDNISPSVSDKKEPDSEERSTTFVTAVRHIIGPADGRKEYTQ
ncbi:uncharacterized protein LOC124262683 isoform X1 [Haliotis rubra]|uniref:uncharacterized protein LOC124262683 isoform X1 n=1 Tax=Haliotis rubra TaxID=36100 RepID=UPI001EE54218|nr:uncharacterized protein LOC124262683 isoform X1 [Haliotis rubra]